MLDLVNSINELNAIVDVIRQASIVAPALFIAGFCAFVALVARN